MKTFWLDDGQTAKIQVACPIHGSITIEVRATGKGVAISHIQCPFKHDIDAISEIRFSMYPMSKAIRIEMPEDNKVLED